MLKTPISLVSKGVSSEIRVCCADIVNSNYRIVRFCIAIPMVLDSNTYGNERKSDVKWLTSRKITIFAKK
jgi:hypothetical protein